MSELESYLEEGGIPKAVIPLGIIALINALKKEVIERECTEL